MSTPRTLFRYLLVGAASNGLGFLAYAALTWLGLSPVSAVTFLYGLAALLGFFGNRRFTFAHRGHWGPAALRYSLVQLSGYGLNLMLLNHLVNDQGFSHLWVQAVLVPVIALYLFLMLRHVAFSETSERPMAS